MKINWAYLKKPSVLIGAVVLFFVLLFLLNRSGGASASGQTVVNSGPTDAQITQETQMAMAQLSAGLQQQAIAVDYAKSQDTNATQLGLATIAAAANTQSLAVQQEIADRTVNAQVHGLDLQYQGLVDQNATALAAAQAQYNYGLASQAINANVTTTLSQQQLEAYAISSANQLEAFKFSTEASIIPTLKAGKRDNAFALLATAAANPSSVNPVTTTMIMAPNGSSGQSNSIPAWISPVGSLL